MGWECGIYIILLNEKCYLLPPYYKPTYDLLFLSLYLNTYLYINMHMFKYNGKNDKSHIIKKKEKSKNEKKERKRTWARVQVIQMIGME